MCALSCMERLGLRIPSFLQFHEQAHSFNSSAAKQVCMDCGMLARVVHDWLSSFDWSDMFLYQ